MTQPLCAYEGCVWHQLAAAHYYRKDLPVSIDNHPFQPQSTVESTPASASPQGAGEACSDCDGSGRTATGSPAVPWRYCTTCRAVEKDRAWLLKRADEEDRTMLTLPTVAHGAVPGPQELDIRLKWDDSADVLYLCFGDTPAKQRFDDSSDDIIRYDKATGEPSGATILCFSERAAEKEIRLRWKLATPEPHSPPITSGYVQEVLPDDA